MNNKCITLYFNFDNTCIFKIQKGMVNDERDNSQLITMFSEDDVSLLTNKGDNTISKITLKNIKR